MGLPPLASSPVVITVARPPGMLRRAERALEHIARRRTLAVLLVVAFALGARAAMLGLLPIPVPVIQDEFSYILGGETLAMGRLANPPHPMWRFFETMHVNMHPTYASKYPPAQAMFLAIGIRIFGHPWYGVWLSMGLLCGAVCWMLQAWLPPKYAFIGGVVTALQIGITGYWINSYWGGTIAALGGALAIGALPRLIRRPGADGATAAAFAIFLLANSRPFEGAVLMALLAIALLWWMRRRGNLYQLGRMTVIAPLLTGVALTAVWMGYYNWKITGNALLLPYVVNAREYHWSSPFWLLPGATPPSRFRDAAMQHFWEWDHEVHMKAHHNPLHVFGLLESSDFGGLTNAFFFPILLAGMLVSAQRARVARLLLGVFCLFLLTEQALLPHYAAPGFGLLALLIMFGFQVLRTIRLGGVAVGLPLVTMILISIFGLSADDVVKTRLAQPESPAMIFRAATLEQLNRTEGRHLVMVRYTARHRDHQEHVYNGPDIDGQKVVWALDRGASEDQALFAYYPDRRIWLYEPDTETLRPWADP